MFNVPIRNILNGDKIFWRQAARNRVRVETLVLASSPWSKYAQYGARFSDLFSAALRDAGLLCLAIYRRIDTEEADTADTEPADGEPGEEGADKVVLNIFRSNSNSHIF